MDFKRITLLCGHYGSGKTNVAVNIAFHLKKQYNNVCIADLDIVNPYFRAKDSLGDFKSAGIRLICSEYANSNVDIPALPQDIYTITADKQMHCVLDIGGDDRGALALGRIRDEILSENNYEMLMVINCYRPLTPDAASTLEVMREIETAAKIKFTGLVNNSNLGELTTKEDVLASISYANEVAKAADIPVVMTTVSEKLFNQFDGEVVGLFPLTLQSKLI